MLLHDQQVRLTARERTILQRLTGSDPYYVTTRAELKAWVEQYMAAMPDEPREIKLLKAVLRRHLPV
ncbi:hypothetical protein [Marinobacter caseinilyticus]|uniref:hypothetical protein n=1 Tax=Marinobacter caseinilyticus TaxID=2692195 RepID=UPI00140B86A3|nr:hypothetical protein [Marinobacter caseinilyticus]